MNPDVWPNISPFYDVGVEGEWIDVSVSWTLGDRFVNAKGRVGAYTDSSAIGLRGHLQTPPPAYPGPFAPMRVSIDKRGDTNTTLTIALDTGETRILDDPFGSPSYFGLASAWLFQVWPQEQEVVDVWVEYHWAFMHRLRASATMAPAWRLDV